jgi:hypothetical protein
MPQGRLGAEHRTIISSPVHVRCRWGTAGLHRMPNILVLAVSAMAFVLAGILELWCQGPLLAGWVLQFTAEHMHWWERSPGRGDVDRKEPHPAALSICILQGCTLLVFDLLAPQAGSLVHSFSTVATHAQVRGMRRAVPCMGGTCFRDSHSHQRLLAAPHHIPCDLIIPVKRGTVGSMARGEVSLPIQLLTLLLGPTSLGPQEWLQALVSPGTHMPDGALAFLAAGGLELEAWWRQNKSTWEVGAPTLAGASRPPLHLTLLTVQHAVVRLPLPPSLSTVTAGASISLSYTHHRIILVLRMDADGTMCPRFVGTDAQTVVPASPAGDSPLQVADVQCVARGSWGTCLPVTVAAVDTEEELVTSTSSSSSSGDGCTNKLDRLVAITVSFLLHQWICKMCCVRLVTAADLDGVSPSHARTLVLCASHLPAAGGPGPQRCASCRPGPG